MKKSRFKTDLLYHKRLDDLVNNYCERSRIIHAPYYLWYVPPILLSCLSPVIARRFSKKNTFIIAPDIDANLWKDKSEQPELQLGPVPSSAIPLKDPRIFLEQAAAKKITKLIILGPDTFSKQNLEWLSVLVQYLNYYPIGCVMISGQQPSRVFKANQFWMRNKDLIVEISNSLTTSEAIKFIEASLPKGDCTTAKDLLKWELLDKELACDHNEYNKDEEDNFYNPLDLVHYLYWHLENAGHLGNS